ncbi:MAG: hypothetical protein IJ234_07940, partial [Clostridia bacterium]|nr:hypothetical protein [Clostridia bacterium]
MRELTPQMDCLFRPLDALSGFQGIVDALGEPCTVCAYGPDDAQRAHLIAALVRALNRPVLVVVPNEMAALRMTDDLNLLLDGRARSLPARDISFLKTAASSRDLMLRRIGALGDCATGEAVALVASVDAMMDRLLPRAQFESHILAIEEGMRIEPAELMEKLVSAGYERVHLVEGRGQCALRGGILDVYPIGVANALRVEFFDDEIDSIRSFDIMTQRSISRRERATLYPANEILLSDAQSAACAHQLKGMLRNSMQDERRVSRQKRIETEFQLMPFDDFIQATRDESDGVEARAKRVENRSALRDFEACVDALETGRRFDGEDSLVPVLLERTVSALNYLPDAMIVLDQPERLRERAENRYLE